MTLWRRLLVPALGLALLAAPAFGYVAQTIVVDGTNDFDPANTVEDDSIDTQTFCSPAALPLEIGKVFVTNDANFLYIGIEHAKTCFCDMNLGVAIEVGGTVAGGTSDPFSRKIGWSSLTNRPDFVVYDVTPTNCNTFNYEALYRWNTGTSAWDNVSTLVNPSYGGGSNGLGIGDGNDFKEIRLPLSVLGATAGTALGLEVWVTQDAATKGPLDAMCSDNVQMSRVGQTTFDTTAVVQMTCLAPYTVLNATDAQPPIVSSALAVNFPLLANRQFGLSTNKIDVTFSEPVQLATAQTASNYTISGAASPLVILAQRDAVANNIVHLTVSSSVSSNANFYNVTVKNVQDVAGNAIVQNGTTNVGSFFIQNATFEGNFKVGMCKGIFAQADTFAVEGNLAPLTFDLRDNALMYDANVDSIWTVTVPFALAKSGATAEADLAWKFGRKTFVNPGSLEFEPLSQNRAYHLSSANGANVTLAGFWNNDDPANFTTHPVDVVFRVNATLRNPTASDTLSLAGSEFPLTFTLPGAPMKDDGVFPDAVAGDKIYSAKVRFPSCASRNISWKVGVNHAFECAGQGDRTFTLNDAGADTVGGTHGPQTLPARGIDRCDVTDKAIKVVFRVDGTLISPDPAGSDTMAVMGNRAPLQFDVPATAAQRMFDNGAGDDAVAGDQIFTRAIVFPDSTPFNVDFKYRLSSWPTNNGFECEGFGNRSLTLNDVTYSVANPLVRVLSAWNFCTEPLAVPIGDAPVVSSASFAVMHPGFPVPFANRTTVRFELKTAGRATLKVYDVSGRCVATLLDGEFEAGTRTVAWDGRSAAGARLGSGVYLAVLSRGSERVGSRLVLTR